MVRKLVKTLLSLTLMVPAAALALGVGDVQLHSALNQRLDAEIELLSVDPDEAETITASLASYDDFAKVGLDRPAALMFLRFGVEQTPSGKYYIKLTSTEAIREPFLDFLIEVKWRSGRVLREYTLLLDPPVSYREAAPAVAAPTAAPTAEAAPMTPSAPEAEFVPPPSAIPVAPGVQAPPAFPARAAAPAEAPAGGIVYGPVKADDTLWRIAQKLRPSADITVQQMMMALLKANPYAFFDNNINRLKKGFVLRIDDPALLTAMGKAEASREVARQTREWQDYREAAAARAAQRQAASAPAGEAPGAAVAKAPAEPKLELVAPEGTAEKPGAGEASAEALQQDLMLALESSAAQRKENEELQKRIEGLEGQLQDTQRLLSLKDADLAALQQQLREQGRAPTLPSEKAEPPLVVKPEEKAAAEAPATVTPEKAPVAEAVTPEKPAAEAEKPEAAKPAPKKPAVQRPRPAPAPVAEPSIIDMILGDKIMLAAGGGTLVLLLLLMAVIIRRRRSGGFQESILSGGTSSMLGAKEEEGVSETSFLSDLAVSGMGGGAISADEGEVDPLTEADVFMAYGRFQQAEDVLKKALEKNPERHELTAKLLEVYYNQQDVDQFVTVVEENEAGLKQNEELWGRVAAMGHELSPEDPLFEVSEGGAAPAVKAPAERAEPISDDILDIGLDLDELTAEMESEGAGADLGLDLGLDFGALEEEEQPSAETKEEEYAPVEEAETSLEFDLELGAEAAPEEEAGGLEFELGELEEAKPAAPAEPEEGEFTLDFGLGAEEEAPAEEIGLDLGELGELDFGELGLEAEAEAEAAPEAGAPAAEEMGLDLSELEGLGDFGDLGELEEEGLLSESDEITTKLDLAQAYIEMGDTDGARSMLEEVAEAGNDEQKHQAEELLAKI